jgi:hypothetical protein
VHVEKDGLLFIQNNFGVDVVVEIRDRVTGGVVLTVGVVAESFVWDFHDLAQGKYDIWIFPAGSPPGQDCGDLIVD